MTENSEWLNEALRNLSADPTKTYRISLHTNDPGAGPLPPSEAIEIRLPSINDPMTIDGIVLYDGNRSINVEISSEPVSQDELFNETQLRPFVARLIRELGEWMASDLGQQGDADYLAYTRDFVVRLQAHADTLLAQAGEGEPS